MGIAICAPVMLLACLIAVVPILHGTLHENWEPVEKAGLNSSDIDAVTGRQVQLVCPPCGEVVRAHSYEALLGALRDHAWTRHGVPHADLIPSAETVSD